MKSPSQKAAAIPLRRVELGRIQGRSGIHRSGVSRDRVTDDAGNDDLQTNGGRGTIDAGDANAPIRAPVLFVDELKNNHWIGRAQRNARLDLLIDVGAIGP